MSLGPLQCIALRGQFRKKLQADGMSVLGSWHATVGLTPEAINLAYPDALTAAATDEASVIAACPEMGSAVTGPALDFFTKLVAAIEKFSQSPLGQQLIQALFQLLIGFIPKGMEGISLSGLLGILSSGGTVMQTVVKGLTAADVALGTILNYIPVISEKITSGVTDAKTIVDQILALIGGTPA
jgi:hypothetical protein